MSLYKVFYVLEDENKLENGYKKVEAESLEEAMSMVPGAKDAKEIDLELDILSAVEPYACLRDGDRIVFYNKEVYQAILSFMYRWQREKPFHRNYDVSKHIWNDRIHQTICVCWYENGECKSYVFGSYV